MMNLRWKIGGGITLLALVVGIVGTGGTASGASAPATVAAGPVGAAQDARAVSFGAERVVSTVSAGPRAAQAQGAAPTVTISGKPALYQPDKVDAPQIPYGSRCAAGNDSFVLANGTRVSQTVTAEGQFVVSLPPHHAAVICGTSSNGATFTVEFGLAGSKPAHLRATFTAAAESRPDVQIAMPGPQFHPPSVNAPEIAPGSACDGQNYSFLLTNTTSASQILTIGGQEIVDIPAGVSTAVCGASSGGAPFTTVMGLESNSGARLVVNFG